MRFLAVLLIFCATLAHAGNGDFIKATINGVPWQGRGDSLDIDYDPGGYHDGIFREHLYYVGVWGLNVHARALRLIFYLPLGAPLKVGPYTFPTMDELMETKNPCAILEMKDYVRDTCSNLYLIDPGAGRIAITSIQGKVVEGTFSGKLRADENGEIWEVTNGAFRFTIP